MEIRKLDQMFEVLGTRAKKRLVAAWAIDAHTIMAVNEAVNMGFIHAILVGDEVRIQAVCREHDVDPAKFTIVHVDNDMAAAITKRANF